MLKGAGLDCFVMPCALQRPIIESQWTIKLPENINEFPWHKKNFRLVVHAQDFVHFHGDLCVELYWLEQRLTPDQQRKTIFVYWDHDLNQIYQGPIQCIEFASHSFEIAHGLKERYHDWINVINKDYQFNWLCLNGRPREHRNRVFELLKDMPCGILTHTLYRPYPDHPYAVYDFDNIENFVRLMPAYQKSKVSIITESIYQNVGGIFTEKTLFAVAAKHPFMTIGSRNIQQRIRNRGFQTFENLFDLSWDNEFNDTRLVSAIKNNADILVGDIDVDQYKDQVDANFEWLMTGYADSIRDLAYNQLMATL